MTPLQPLEPAVYRRRSPLVEAYQLNGDNAWQLSEQLGGRLAWTRDEQPLLRLPKSMQPARAGDFLCRELTRAEPWYPYRGDLFTDVHEPAACLNCGHIPGGG